MVVGPAGIHAAVLLLVSIFLGGMIDDFDMFSFIYQAKRDLYDPENALIGAFSGKKTSKLSYPNALI